MPKKPKAPKPKVNCPICGRMMSKVGLNGHMYNVHGQKPNKQGAGPSLSPPAPSRPKDGNASVTTSMKDDLLAEIGLTEDKETKELRARQPTIEDLQSQHTIDAKAWSGILWMAGSIVDEMVDIVKERYPEAIIKKANVTTTRADHLGDLCYKVFGPCDPAKALAIELMGIFMPPCIGMLIAILPKEVILKMTGGLTKGFNNVLSKLKPPTKQTQGPQDDAPKAR